MQCPTCGYMMDAFTAECPRCKRISSTLPHLTSNEQYHKLTKMGMITTEAPTVTSAPILARPNQRKQIIRRRAYAVTSMNVISLLLLFLGMFAGGALILISLIGAKADERNSPLILGISILLATFIAHVLFAWGAELLRTLGLIDDRLLADAHYQEPSGREH